MRLLGVGADSIPPPAYESTFFHDVLTYEKPLLTSVTIRSRQIARKKAEFWDTFLGS